MRRMNTLELRGSTARIPVLGMGTWHMGEDRGEHAAELAALRAGIDMGYRLIDTAEMYAEGGAEQLVGEAVAQAVRSGSVEREDLFIVSKAYPHNAGRQGLPAACACSLERLGLDYLDLYLLHWRGEYPLEETVDGMRDLVAPQYVVPVHYEGWAHFTEGRAELEAAFAAAGLSDRLRWN